MLRKVDISVLSLIKLVRVVLDKIEANVPSLEVGLGIIVKIYYDI